MSLEFFAGLTDKKTIKKKEEKKIDEFESDAKEIIPLLKEVMEANTKVELKNLAKQYQLTNYTSLEKEEIQNLLIESIRKGCTKNIDEFEKLGYSEWQYRCCNGKFSLKIRTKTEPKKKYCPYCNEIVVPKKS